MALRAARPGKIAGVPLPLAQAFFQEHRRCGELDGGVEGDRVSMTCRCGAVINRNADRD
jgi:hypothetical protein